MYFIHLIHGQLSPYNSDYYLSNKILLVTSEKETCVLPLSTCTPGASELFSCQDIKPLTETVMETFQKTTLLTLQS